MSNLTAQIESIDAEIAELADKIKELKTKREALAKLEDTYNETLVIVQETAALMVAGGLDPKVLATEIRNLIAPKKSDKPETINTDTEYEVIEVETVKPSATPIPTPAPTPEAVKTEPTVQHNKFGLSVTVPDTSSKNYGRVEASKSSDKAPTTPKATPTPTPSPKPVATTQETASNDDVTKWSMTQLKEYVRKYWTEADVSAFMKDGGYKKVEKLGWIKIVMRIRANASKKAA